LAADRRPGSLGNRPLYNQISGIDSSARREGIGVNVTKPPALPAAVVCQGYLGESDLSLLAGSRNRLIPRDVAVSAQATVSASS
jgi:hypothetical protein